MKLTDKILWRGTRFNQFLKFCLVGGSGVAVDMTVLYFLASRNWIGWDISLSKACAAETALLNNFFLNDLWTFRISFGNAFQSSRFSRLLRFNAICGVGILLSVILLKFFNHGLGLNLYLANFLAILSTTLWNFWMNAIFNWRTSASSRKAIPETDNQNAH